MSPASEQQMTAKRMICYKQDLTPRKSDDQHERTLKNGIFGEPKLSMSNLIVERCTCLPSCLICC